MKKNSTQTVNSQSSSLTDFSMYTSCINVNNSNNTEELSAFSNISNSICSSHSNSNNSNSNNSSFFSHSNSNDLTKNEKKSIGDNTLSCSKESSLSSVRTGQIEDLNFEQFNKLFDKCVLNKIYIDVAVICEEYTNIELMCQDHIINLDEIDITMDIFQHIFYPYKETFGLNKDFLISNCKLLPFISFLPEFRTVNKKKFYLLEELLVNIESDLSISRNCFTKESLVELTNEITSIKSLLDINCCSVLSSLTWSNILEIIKNYELIKTDVVPILIVNIVFKTPTQGVKDTIIRFQYKICNIN